MILYFFKVSAIKKNISQSHFDLKKIVENLKSVLIISYFFLINSQQGWLFVYLSILHRFNIETEVLKLTFITKMLFIFWAYTQKYRFACLSNCSIQFWMHIQCFSSTSGYSLIMRNQIWKSVISPDKNSRWQHNILWSYTDLLLISNSLDN